METAPKLSSLTASGPDHTVLGQSVELRGELSGSEDLLIDGHFEGNITLRDYCLTIGAHGQVKAEVQARQVVVHGALSGNISAREKIEIRKSGHVVGDLLAGAIAIEEGAYFKGSIDILREEAREGPRVVATSSAFKASS